MPPSNDGLEGKIGELSGILKGIGPVIERLEENYAQLNSKLSAMSADLKNLKHEFFPHRRTSEERFLRMDALERECADLKENNQKSNAKYWDLLKIAIAALIGGLASYLFQKLGVKPNGP